MDEDGVLEGILGVLAEVSTRVPVIFPVHPRSRARLGTTRGNLPGLRLTGPLGYLDFLSLEAGAAAVVTDSGGVQEETTCLGVPCITVRDSTERPVTVASGTNRVIGRDPGRLRDVLEAVLGGGRSGAAGGGPPLWDGRTAQRIADVLTGSDVAPGPGGRESARD